MLLPTRVTAGTPIVCFGPDANEDANEDETLFIMDRIRGALLVRCFCANYTQLDDDILDLCVFQPPASSYSVLSVHTNVYFLLSEWSTGKLQRY